MERRIQRPDLDLDLAVRERGDPLRDGEPVHGPVVADRLQDQHLERAVQRPRADAFPRVRSIG